MNFFNKRAGRMAPPPPPLPEGMTVVQEEEGRMNVTPPPPPPPIPNEMLRKARTNSEKNMQPSMSGTRGGRPALSLTDAVNFKEEAERKALEEAAKPHVIANGGNLDVNDFCYARSGTDGLYYFAKIEQYDSEKANLIFFDEAVEIIKFSKIYTVKKVVDEMQCFANWSNQGNYYPAKIQSISDDGFIVSYDENPELTEDLSFDLVRFAPW